jgi:hypothetical protein
MPPCQRLSVTFGVCPRSRKSALRRFYVIQDCDRPPESSHPFNSRKLNDFFWMFPSAQEGFQTGQGELGATPFAAPPRSQVARRVASRPTHQACL